MTASPNLQKYLDAVKASPSKQKVAIWDIWQSHSQQRGRVIELRGMVDGTMVVNGQRSFILKVGTHPLQIQVAGPYDAGRGTSIWCMVRILDASKAPPDMELVMETAADSKITIVLSSHLVADLERVCDHLVVLSSARTQVVGEIGALLDSHRVLVGPHCDSGEPDIAGVASIVERTDSERQTSLLVRTNGTIRDPRWASEPVTLEDLVLAYLARPGASALPAPRVMTQASAS